MAKHYTELTGAGGTRIEFGPPRFPAADHFLGAPPKVQLWGGTYELVMIGALAFTVGAAHLPEALRASPGEKEGHDCLATFVQGGRTITSAMVVVTHAVVDGQIECRFRDQAIDLDALAHDNASAVASSRVVRPAITRSDVPSEYKVFCADMLDVMATMRRQIEQDIMPFERSLSADERAALDMETEAAISGEWLEFLRRANSLVLPFKHDDAMRLRMKKYTENVVTGEMCRGALQRRCYEKPMGYPGDFEIMNAFYDNRPRGEDAYARLVDMLGLIAGRPVAKRMHYLTSELERLTASADDRQHYHVMSVGAGPAREFRRYFENGSGENVGFSITLVDPETQALDCAIRNIYSSVKSGVSSIMVSGMNSSFTEMLRPKSTFRHLPQQDFIYSAGLTDYLNTKLTRSLILKLYDFLKPGGKVLIGNVNDAPDGMYWSAEYAVDWSMFFRNMAEMEEIADGMPGNPQLTSDASGSYFILTLTKPH